MIMITSWKEDFVTFKKRYNFLITKAIVAVLNILTRKDFMTYFFLKLSRIFRIAFVKKTFGFLLLKQENAYTLVEFLF